MQVLIERVPDTDDIFENTYDGFKASKNMFMKS